MRLRDPPRRSIVTCVAKNMATYKYVARILAKY